MSTKKPSINDRALGAIQKPSEAPAPIQPVKRIQTGPGLMSAHMAKESEALRENEALKDELKQWEGASPAKLIDPTLITRSKWANRHEQSFTDESFKQLKAEIQSAGGNVQPIKVRPLVGQGGKYEIVFGHRRHQACLELEQPVLAMIENLDEQQLFTQMDQENRQRKDLRPYEQGMMYKRALDEGLFPSQRKLAKGISVDLSLINKAINLAELPAAIVGAFGSPLDLQYRWGTLLTKAVNRNPELIIERAKTLKASGERLGSSEILARLLEEEALAPPPKVSSIEIHGISGEVGEIKFDSQKRTAHISLENIDPKRFSDIENAIKSVVSV